MLLKALLPFLPLAVLAGPLTSPPRNCGLKIAPCPEDYECIPKHSSCTDLNRCLGTCQPVKYSSCGGFRVEPRTCKGNEVCRDDPRREGSCGMACDAPGICTPKNVQPCDEKGCCPKGLTCYDLKGKGTVGWDEVCGVNKVCL